MVTENRENVNNAAAVDTAVNNKTIADIIAEMRRGTRLPGYWRSCDLNKILKYHADRLEAALKREKDEIEADALAAGGIVEAERHKPGNAAAMREALVALTDKVIDYLQKGLIQLPLPLEEATAKARAVLSAPLRNCDVGTLTEQQQRFHDFCEKMQHTDKACCGGCPIVHLRMKGIISNSCELAWVQMPYTEGGAK